MEYHTLLPLAITAATKACEEVLTVYHSNDFHAEAKEDRSPLTLADKKAHDIIVTTLAATGIPVLSEEGSTVPYNERAAWDYFWLIDPLDGTKEFIKRNGEFTVNIALIYQGAPLLGVVAVPVAGDVFYAAKGSGAFLQRDGVEKRLPSRAPISLKQDGLRVIASRSHMNKETEEFIGKLPGATLVSAGSSLKFMLLAEGKADVYPRFAPTMEWDTAAAHAIVNEVGLNVLQHGTPQPLVYNKPDMHNPWFVVM